MTDCSLEEPSYLPRIDWLYWEENKSQKDIKRIPIFSDYTVRHPVHYESLQFFSPSTTLKYTTKKDWMIIKGQRTKFELYLANASLLVGREEFKNSTNGQGASFSFGDDYIVKKAKHYTKYMKELNKGNDIKGTGTSPTWIRALISHHIALVMHQLATLDD